MFELIPWKKKNEGGLATRDSFENQFARIRDDFNTLTERMFGDWSGFTNGLADTHWGWGFDMDEAENEFVVRAEAPGFEVGDFDVQVSGHQLVIKAEKNQEEKSDNGSTTRRRSFQRSMTLPQGALVENVEATYKNGILELHLPKGEDCKTRSITVQSG